MRDSSKRIVPPLPADFGDRITAARASQATYDRHVAPIVTWALIEAGSRRGAWELCRTLKFDDATSDAGIALLDRAMAALR